MKLRKQNKWSPVIVACGTIALSAGLAHSAILINVSPTDTGATVSVVGSLNIDGLTGTPAGASIYIARFTNSDGFLLTPANITTFPGVTTTGNLSGVAAATGIAAAGGIPLSVGVSGGSAGVPVGYVSDQFLEFDVDLPGNFFANTGGTLVIGESLRVTLSNNDFIEVTTSAAIPEPSSSLVLGALLFAGFLRRRR